MVADFGLMLRQNDPNYTLQELLAFNRRCIEMLSPQFTTLWLEDHFQWENQAESLECLSTLIYLAAQYPRLKIGQMVLCQSYRNPALLAKIAANVQAISGGRMILGLGAGWKEDEYKAYGYSFPPVKERLEQLEEAAQVIRALWTSLPATFEGRHYQIHNAICAPRPEPAIPLLIGGGGEKKTLAIVARRADWWNFNSATVEQYAHKVAVLKRHCEHIGRDPGEIKLTYLSTLSVSEDPARVQRSPDKHFIAGNAAEVSAELRAFQRVGVSHFIFRILDTEALEHFITNVAPNFAHN